MRRKLNALTSLRFIAAAMILFHHTKHYLAVEPSWVARIPLDHGVSFFFVLSGFILAYTYPSFSGAKDEARFLFARLARLWPVHLVGFLVLLIAFPVAQLAADPTQLKWIIPSNLLLVHGWILERSFYFSLNTVSWSISAELFFYLCFPVLIRNWERTWAIKLTLTLVLLVSLIAYGNWLRLPGFPQDGLTTHGLTYVNPAARLFEFVLGMSGYIFWKRKLIPLQTSSGLTTLTEVAAVGLTLYFLFFQPLKVSKSFIKWS